MNPNILLKNAPLTVDVGGVSVPIATDHRTGIRVLQMLDDPLMTSKQKYRLLLVNYYKRGVDEEGNILVDPVVLDNAQEALAAAISFLNFNEEKPPPLKGRKDPIPLIRTFDWDMDAGRIIADFVREYGIDLARPKEEFEMHWWRFYSLFLNLSNTSATMTAISIRGTVPDKDWSDQQKEVLKRQQAKLLLPARTKEEAMQLTKFVHGSIRV